MIVAARMAACAPDVALGNLSFDRVPRSPGSAEVHSFDLAGAMVEIKASCGGAAVDAAALALHTGHIEAGSYRSEDGGPKLIRSVLKVRSEHGRAIHPTQKPVGIVDPLIRFSVPRDGLVLDPFVGSGTTLVAAKQSGRRAIGIEIREEYCEAAVKRFDQQSLDLELATALQGESE